MSALKMNCIWTLSGPVHLGTGLSRGGYADRLIRRDAAGRPLIPGDAVKGAVRMSAERLLRWLVPSSHPEKEDKSLPTNPVLKRIFAANEWGPYYRFGSAPERSRARPRSGRVAALRIAATAIDRASRTALDQTLRTVEAASRHSEFEVTLECDGGAWDEPGSLDARDAQFLAVSLLAADAIGGKRGVGFGRIGVAGFNIHPDPGWDVASEVVIESLRAHLAKPALEN